MSLLQPQEAASLPDVGGSWAPLVPYWAVLWRSGVTLARFVSSSSEPLAALRVVELGCGLGLPSLVAASRGASVLATDYEPEALSLLSRNASENGVSVETMEVDWSAPDALVARGPFDLVLAADVLYDADAIAPLLALLPRLAPRVWLADPGREPAAGFFERLQGVELERVPV
jgi:predicted nicotinamide N-methyase